MRKGPDVDPARLTLDLIPDFLDSKLIKSLST